MVAIANVVEKKTTKTATKKSISKAYDIAVDKISTHLLNNEVDIEDNYSCLTLLKKSVTFVPSVLTITPDNRGSTYVESHATYLPTSCVMKGNGKRKKEYEQLPILPKSWSCISNIRSLDKTLVPILKKACVHRHTSLIESTILVAEQPINNMKSKLRNYVSPRRYAANIAVPIVAGASGKEKVTFKEAHRSRDETERSISPKSKANFKRSPANKKRKQMKRS